MFPSIPHQMLARQSAPVFHFAELCGLSHAEQVVEIPLSENLPAVFALQSDDGRIFRGQRSRLGGKVAFVKLGVHPFENIVLNVAQEGEMPAGGSVSFCVKSEGRGILSNGQFSLEVFLGIGETPMAGFDALGPILRLKVGEGLWRCGGVFFDSRRSVSKIAGEVLEEGPLRIVYRYRAEFAPGGFYQATITVDDGTPFAAVEEEFQAGRGDQVVWDFSGADLPGEFYALDSTAAFRTRPLAYPMDGRLARLAAWTQQSQHLDFVDGFAFRFRQGDEIVGFVTLEGGKWRGASLNQLEAWTRRWLPGDPASRRDVPASAKADGYPGPERVLARGGVLCEEHFNVEGWIGCGRRKFALVLTQKSAIEPENAFSEPPLEHFECKADRDRYRRQQSLLRRIHIQHGVMPLQEILHLDFSWPEEPARALNGNGFEYPNLFLSNHLPEPGGDPRAAVRAQLEYLSARVYGFWEGSGLAYTNPVVSRRIAPELFRYEWLVRQGAFSPEEQRLVRALFAFLIHLFASENCYTGDAAMLPSGSPDSTEPTLQGMANQNFYTDVINLVGAGAQVLFAHPLASAWRARFIEQWHRQLAFHVYPESGVWEESHTYYEHVLLTVLPTLLRRRADGVDDEFATEPFQKMVAAALKQITPRDGCLGDRRYVIAFGDHSPDPGPKRFLALALAFAEANSLLARQLAWAAREMGSQEAMGLPAEAPAWRSEAVQGLGVMFRAVDGSGAESLLALRSGLAWGHHHNDDGSIQFFAKGRSLVVDSAFGMNQAGGMKVEAAGHSRWTLRDLQPVNYLWRFNRGWVTGGDLWDRFPWASSFSPVYSVKGGAVQSEQLASPALHWRTVVQLDATTYLVADSSRCEQPQVVRFHIAGRGVTQESDRVLFDFPQGRLTVMPIFAAMPARLGENHSDGEKTPGDYTTTSVSYDTGALPFVAFLLRAGEPGEHVAVDAGAAACTLRAGDLDVEIFYEPEAGRLVIADRRGGRSGNIDLLTNDTHYAQ